MKKSQHTSGNDRFRFAAFAAATAAGFALLLAACNESPTKTPEEETPPDRETLIAEGEAMFQSCEACHGHGGVGESAPPLLHSDYLIAERMRPVRILLMGLPNPIDENPITVNGIEHQNSMYAIATQSEWTNRQIAAVLTYVRAVLNDSTSTDCVVSENGDGQLESSCTIVKSPDDATTMITPDEVAALRDSLDNAGLLDF